VGRGGGEGARKVFPVFSFTGFFFLKRIEKTDGMGG
jgi:hypothetical protein